MEVGSPISIEAHDLSIKSGLTAYGVGEFDFEIPPLLERVAGARDESAVMAVNVRECAERIELQLEERRKPCGV